MWYLSQSTMGTVPIDLIMTEMMILIEGYMRGGGELGIGWLVSKE